MIIETSFSILSNNYIESNNITKLHKVCFSYTADYKLLINKYCYRIDIYICSNPSTNQLRFDYNVWYSYYVFTINPINTSQLRDNVVNAISHVHHNFLPNICMQGCLRQNKKRTGQNYCLLRLIFARLSYPCTYYNLWLFTKSNLNVWCVSPVYVFLI